MVLGKTSLKVLQIAYFPQRPHECSICKPSSLPTTEWTWLWTCLPIRTLILVCLQTPIRCQLRPILHLNSNRQPSTSNPSFKANSTAINIQCKFQMVKWGESFFSHVSLMSGGMQRFADICLHRTKINPFERKQHFIFSELMSHTNHKQSFLSSCNNHQHILLLLIEIEMVKCTYMHSFPFEETILMINWLPFHLFLG